MFTRWITCLTAAVIAGVIAPPVAGQTADQAKAFFKEFDDATLHGRGPVTKQVYGGGDSAAAKQQRRLAIGRDIFDGFSDNAGKQINMLALDAHGKGNLVPAAARNQVANRYTQLKNNGALQRLSDLQLKIIKKHFPMGGGIDFTKFQNAMEMFGNGELRPQAEMDQMYQFVVWKRFAEVAIDKNVNKADWEKALKSIETSLEMHRQVYPSTNVARTTQFLGELQGSTPAQFDGTKQFNANQKTALRNQIAALTTAQVLDRQQGLIKDMTPLVATVAVLPRNIDMQVASMQPLFGGFDMTLALTITDDTQTPVVGDDVGLTIYGGGLTLTPEAFFLELDATPQGPGSYSASFHWPALSVDAIGFVALAEDRTAGQFQTLGVVIPEPATAMAVLGLFGLGVGRRRR